MGNMHLQYIYCPISQLIEYNRNIFLDKFSTKSDAETICRPFSKKSKSNTSWDQLSKILCSLFLLYDKLMSAIEVY